MSITALDLAVLKLMYLGHRAGRRPRPLALAARLDCTAEELAQSVARLERTGHLNASGRLTLGGLALGVAAPPLERLLGTKQRIRAALPAARSSSPPRRRRPGATRGHRSAASVA